MANTPEKAAWYAMLDRCYNEKHPAYHRYGGRGIVVCEEWQNSFKTFLFDIGQRPSGEHSLQRINNDCGYYKANCKWALANEQGFNKTNNHKLSVANTSGVKGVSYDKTRGRWLATCQDGPKRKILYQGPNKEDAIVSRQIWEERYGRL